MHTITYSTQPLLSLNPGYAPVGGVAIISIDGLETFYSMFLSILFLSSTFFVAGDTEMLSSY